MNEGFVMPWLWPEDVDPGAVDPTDPSTWPIPGETPPAPELPGGGQIPPGGVEPEPGTLPGIPGELPGQLPGQLPSYPQQEEKTDWLPIAIVGAAGLVTLGILFAK